MNSSLYFLLNPTGSSDDNILLKSGSSLGFLLTGEYFLATLPPCLLWDAFRCVFVL